MTIFTATTIRAITNIFILVLIFANHAVGPLSDFGTRNILVASAVVNFVTIHIDKLDGRSFSIHDI